MIIAGIDEAGLGPKLGPLTVSMAAFKATEDIEVTDIDPTWDILAKTTTSKRRDKNSKLLITDSKIAYNSLGINGLKKIVFSFAQEIFTEYHQQKNFSLLSLICPEEDCNTIKNTDWYKTLFPLPPPPPQ